MVADVLLVCREINKGNGIRRGVSLRCLMFV
jgi:hypothetical protein